MTERTPESPRTKFAVPRDEMLYRMTLEQWGCESAGMSTSPVGWFCWMSNSEAELADIVQAFGDQFEEVGLSDPHELVGNWLIVEGNQGFVDVYGYPSEDELRAAYRELELRLDEWEAGGVQ